MKAMILAAGLGTRLRPLTEYRAKPALPICGRPVISLLLEVLARHGFQDVMINLHYLPDSIQSAVEFDCPKETRLTWSVEPEPLGTGGGLYRAASFLESEEHFAVLAGDMLMDLDWRAAFDRHKASGQSATLLLRDDPRGVEFGTIGLDAGGHVTRIGQDCIAGAAQETTSGLFTGVRFFARSVLDHWPEALADVPVFEDLRDWLVPAHEKGLLSVAGDCLPEDESVWEPVGTPAEYLEVNLSPPVLPSLGASTADWLGDVRFEGDDHDVVMGRGARLPKSAALSQAVVWEDETVPADLSASHGVFCAGAFHPVQTNAPRTNEHPARNRAGAPH